MFLRGKSWGKNSEKVRKKSAEKCENYETILPFSCCPLVFPRKILVSVKFVSAILGPEMAAPISWTPGKSHVHKFLVLGGGGILGFGGGGGSADFVFMGARIFLIHC